MHRLLQRQVKKHLSNALELDELATLLEDISTSYINFDEDYKRLERILEVSSQELFRANQLVLKEKEIIREELKESYKKFEEFDKAVNASFIVSITDTEGTIISVNDKFIECTGYTRQELQGKNHNLLSANHHTPKFWKELWTTLLSGNIWNGEIKNRKKNGDFYWGATNIIPFYNALGQVYQFMSITVDITERKTAEDELKKLGLIAQKTLNLVVITDAEGKITWVNEGFEKLSEYTLAEAMGKKPGALLQGPASNPDVIQEMSKAIKKGLPFNGEIYNYSKSKKGYWLSSNITPIFEDDETLTGFIAIQSDITERKKINEELKASEERWKYALSGNEDGVWDWNLETNEVFFNTTWKSMLGYAENEIENHLSEWEKRVHPDDLEDANAKVNAHINGDTPYYSSEHRLLCKDGNYKWILDRGKIIESMAPDGKKNRRFIGTHTDITLLKEAKEKERIAELILKNSPTILVRWKPNFKLTIDYISENIRNFGYDAKTWVKNQIPFIYYVHPDDVKPVTKIVIQSFRTKADKVKLRFRLQNSNGEYRWVDSENNIEWDAEKKQAQHFQGVFTDITEQVEAEQKLIESENRFRSLVQNSNDITTILNKETIIVYKSPSFYRTFGYTEDEIIGKSIFEFVHPDDVLSAQSEFMKGVERGGISDPIEFRMRHKNNSYIFVESIGNNQLNVPGINGIVINSRDITDRKEAEKESKRLRDFYEVILNKIPTDVVVFDNKHRYMFVNEAAIRDPEKRAYIIGKDDYDYCEKYGRDKKMAHERRAIFNKVAFNKQQIEFEEPIDTKNGRIWVLRRMFPLFDANGELTNMIGFGLDITERKAAEARLKESEERLSLAITAAKLGIWDWNLVANQLIWDKEMYPLFDLDAKSFNGDYDAFEQTLHPDDKMRVFESVNATIAGKQGDYKDTFRIITKKGEIKYVAAISKLIKDNKQKPIRMIGVNFDVTESKLAEERILKWQAELEEAQHIARVGSWEIDMTTQTITWSREMYAIHELKEDEYTPTLDSVHLYYTPDTRQQILDAFKTALHDKKGFDIEAQITTKKGRIIDVKTKGVPIIKNGRVPHIKGIFQDITKEKAAERKLKEYTGDLERINKELDQFAYIVSHDLKAPLRAINNLSMWIEEDISEHLEGDTKYQFQLLRGRVGRLEDLINGILSYSRAGRIKVTPTKVDVGALINGILEMLSPPPEFTITIPPVLPTINTEKIALEQVFSNLISNAIKYNKNPSPTIKVTFETIEGFLKFGVIDNGDGIEAEYHEKIFVIFQTLEARDKVESTGVGLAIVKKIVDEKGGQIWVESEKGNGARFYFTWPTS